MLKDVSREAREEKREQVSSIPGTLKCLTFSEKHFATLLLVHLEELALQARSNGFNLVAADLRSVAKRADFFFRYSQEPAYDCDNGAVAGR